MEYLEKAKTTGEGSPVKNNSPVQTGDLNPSLERAGSTQDSRRKEKISFQDVNESVASHKQLGCEISSPTPLIQKNANIPPLKLEDDESLQENEIIADSIGGEKERRVYVIGVTGAANCGKTFYSSLLKYKAEQSGLTVSIIKERNFMKEINIKDESNRMNYLRNYDLDSPEAVDMDLFIKGINYLKNREPFNTPLYSLSEFRRLENTERIAPCDLLILEGRFIVSERRIRDLCDYTVYLHCDTDLLVTRRVFKEIALGRSIEDIVYRYQNFVKPAFIKYIESHKAEANITVSEPIIDYGFMLTEQGGPERIKSGNYIMNDKISFVIEAINAHLIKDCFKKLGKQSSEIYFDENPLLT